MKLDEKGPATVTSNVAESSTTMSQLHKISETPIAVSPPAVATRLREFISTPFTAAFCAGGVAGAVSRTVVSPLERLKILYQVQSVGRNEYKMSVGKALAKMWRDEGWRGFMRGNGTNCIRIVPYSAVQFGSFNLYKRFVEHTTGTDLTSLGRLLCGGCAGITSVTFTYPLDIVRTRLSIQTASFASLKKSEGKPPGMWPTMVSMYKNEGGMRGLYRGIIPTVAGVAPYVGLNFMVYEAVRDYFTAPGEKNPPWYRKLAAGAISGAITMIVKQEGIPGLYKGIMPNLLKVAPSMASSWLSFELTRDFLVSLSPDAEEPIL